MLLGVVYSFIPVIEGVRQKKQGSVLYIIAMFALLITAAHDSLFLANVIKSKVQEIAFIGVFVLLFVHSLIHVKKSASEYNEKVTLLHEVERSKEMAIANERRFLQAQIRPHFLFNTLSVIASLSTRDPSKTRELIIHFSEYLRSSFDFDSADDLVPIYKEFELIGAYIAIEKARFGERINFILNCGIIPEIRIPRLSIQPLVENAIRHGILKKSQGGTVILKIKADRDNVIIEVIDDGGGMSPEQIHELLSPEEGRGVGVKNINNRLKSLYGSGLYISSEPGRGTIFGFRVSHNGSCR
jgi:sensor histidine kinase YesM